VTIHRQEVLADPAFESDGEMPCFPRDVQRALSGYKEKMSGQNLFRAKTIPDGLTPGYNADTPTHYYK